MSYRAVALTQVDGAGAEPIGLALAGKLGFAYLNEAIVAEVASDHEVDPALVAEAERRKSLLDRIFERAALGAVDGVGWGSWPYPLDESDKLLSLIRDAVRDAAGRGRVVLVAHAACYACADLPDVLRVCVTAPLAARVARMASLEGVSEKDAAKSLRRSDAGRADYLKRAYGVAEEAPADYDIVLNTERIDTEAAVDLLAGLVRT